MRTLSLALLLSAAALPAVAQQAAPSAAALHLRTLTWPGKVEAPAPRQAAPQAMSAPQAMPGPRADEMASATPPALRQTRADPAWRFAYRPVAHRASHMLGDLTPAQARAVAAQRAEAVAEAEKAKAEAQTQTQPPARAEPRAPARVAPALPSSIYAAPPPAQASRQPIAMPPSTNQAPTRLAAASPYDQGVRYYSLHRAYGEKPDPVTLSPQFLSSASPDLANPPPPLPPRILPGQTPTAAQLTAARQAQQGSDSSGN